MGYYSKVAISIYEEDYKKMIKDALASEYKENIIGILKDAEMHERRFFGSDMSVITLYWDSVKWYEGELYSGSYNGFREVDFIMEYMDGKIPAVFCRVGEDWDDIERYSHNDEKWILGSSTYIFSSIFINSCKQIDSAVYVDEEISKIQKEQAK